MSDFNFKFTNHLASTTEKLAAAGKKPPKHLLSRLQHLHSCTKKVQLSLAHLLPQDILDSCTVTYADTHTITIALHSVTAANHLRYQSKHCLMALRHFDHAFRQLDELKVIVVPKFQNRFEKTPNLH
ncbi:hypothetical protein LU293_02950 [Moraxella nasovis]|uniref:hypothetical protein n=1 Tax=Moraxella nasovis TaxID=2904121 RepID=UPI001F610337|nr:hypothetical protein [Moraxella nasovis]UNU73873.1 hypothetical protein LU293_02950 [Moraxella nasovis]